MAGTLAVSKVKKCKVKGCENDAVGFVHIKIPNTENHDAINPVRVDVCTGHLRELLPRASFSQWDEAHGFDLARFLSCKPLHAE